jgi:lysylphosphatidylglycerol synthetase-like protein (DUF2156 family)
MIAGPGAQDPAPPSSLARTISNSESATPSLIALVAFLFLALLARIATGLYRRSTAARRRAIIPAFAFLTLLVLAATIVGCHHYKSPAIGNTPKGTYNLTVTGSAQNASRGFTMTLVVD